MTASNATKMNTSCNRWQHLSRFIISSRLRGIQCLELILLNLLRCFSRSRRIAKLGRIDLQWRSRNTSSQLLGLEQRRSGGPREKLRWESTRTTSSRRRRTEGERPCSGPNSMLPVVTTLIALCVMQLKLHTLPKSNIDLGTQYQGRKRQWP